MLEKKVISSELFCFLYKNKKKMFSTGSLIRPGLVQIASEMNQEALSIHTGQWSRHIEYNFLCII